MSRSLGLNLSKMKKVASDKHSSTFMHPNGHKIVIVHSKLDPAHRKQVESIAVDSMLHKYADGGVVNSLEKVSDLSDKLPMPAGQTPKETVQHGTISPILSPPKLVASLSNENNGNVGGTIRDGSRDEIFVVGNMIFNVEAAKKLSQMRSNGMAKCSGDWSDRINVEEDHAIMSDSGNPVMIAMIPTEQGLAPLLFDGHHRMYKAMSEGKSEIPAYIFSPEESMAIMSAPPDLMYKLRSNLTGMGAPQKFAKGGKVQRMADGGQPDPYNYVTNDDPTAPGAPPLPGNNYDGIPAIADRSPASLPGYEAINAPPDEQTQALAAPETQESGGQALSNAVTPGGSLAEQYGPPEPMPGSNLPPPASASDLPDYGQPVGMGQPSARAPGSMPAFGAGMPFNVNDIYKTGEAGIEAQEQGSQQLAQAQAKAEQAYQQSMQADQQAWDSRSQQMQSDIDHTIKDMRSGAINPNRYMQNMSVPGHIASILGMIIGGAGAGAGRPNPAVDMLNQQIDRDINAQKTNLENQQNILGAYQAKYGNALTAEKMTRATIMGNYASQLQEAADNAADPLSRARALAAKAQLQQQMIPLINQANAIQFLQSDAHGQRQSPGLIDQSKWNVLQRFGFMSQQDSDNATKEAQGLLANNALKQDYIQSFNSLNSKLAAGALTPGDRDAYVNTLAARLQRTYSNRFNMDELHAIADGSLPKLGDLPSTDRDKLQQGVSSLDGLMEATPTLDRYGLRNRRPMQSSGASGGYRVGQVLRHGNDWIQITDRNGNYRKVSNPNG